MGDFVVSVESLVAKFEVLLPHLDERQRRLALAAEARMLGHGGGRLAALLREEGFSLQADVKTLEGNRHPDRDGQFRYINDLVKDHRDAGDPVVSVDTKKKELIGRFANGGREWRPAGEPEPVNTHDFPRRRVG
jgi:hypothetical protein